MSSCILSSLWSYEAPLRADIGNPPPYNLPGCMHVRITHDDLDLMFRTTFAGQQPDVTCAQSCRHVKLIRQLRTATGILSACFFWYFRAMWSIVHKMSTAQEQITNEQIYEYIVITGSLWVVVRWVFVAYLYYCIRFSQYCLPYLPTSSTTSTSYMFLIILKSCY